ncbi:unnamed protein product [Arabis nemorensis]|uniref:Aminotransferase-like plant mobile domain-containing protein n=1 Tax=Arabis nemorensis TaxID=586526 RepID=A0A565BH74_9BRAS|nr:unnamed protein product [Arabis nemorensis]
MQFGLSQDLPGLVTHLSNFTEKGAWDDYNKSLDGLKLYIPSRLATTSVTARYQDWWLKSVSEFGQVVQKLGAGFRAKLKRCRKRRKAKNVRFEIKKGKIGDCGGSTSREVTLSELFQKELMKRKNCSTARNRAKVEVTDEEDETRSEAEKIAIVIPPDENNSSEPPIGSIEKNGEKQRDDSGLCDKFASEDETVANQEIEQRSEEKEEETASKVENTMVLVLSNEINSSDPPLVACTNERIPEIVVSPPETRQNCDGEADVNGSNAETKTMIDDGTKEEVCLLCGNREKQRDDSSRCQKIASEDETVELHNIEQRNEENDDETVLFPSDENNSSDLSLVASHGEIVETAVSPQETRQNCDVNGSYTEEKTMIDDRTKEEECLIHENGENQEEKLCSEVKKEEEETDERLKQRKIAIEKIALKLEARMAKVEKSLVTIRDWKTRG